MHTEQDTYYSTIFSKMELQSEQPSFSCLYHFCLPVSLSFPPSLSDSLSPSLSVSPPMFIYLSLSVYLSENNVEKSKANKTQLFSGMRFSSVALLKSWSRREALLMKTLSTTYPSRRLLMSSSVLILPQAMGVVTAWLRKYSVNMLTSAPRLWNSISHCVRKARRRERDRWQRVWSFTPFSARSLHPEVTLISLTCSPCQEATTSGSWYTRTISLSSVSSEQ